MKYFMIVHAHCEIIANESTDVANKLLSMSKKSCATKFLKHFKQNQVHLIKKAQSF